MNWGESKDPIYQVNASQGKVMIMRQVFGTKVNYHDPSWLVRVLMPSVTYFIQLRDIV